MEDNVIFMIVVIIFFLLATFVILNMENKIEIQNVKSVDDGYYITIDNEIYYKEVID